MCLVTNVQAYIFHLFHILYESIFGILTAVIMKKNFRNVKPSDLVPTLQRKVLPLEPKQVTGASAVITEATASSEKRIKC